MPATLPSAAQEDFPHVAISNGLITRAGLSAGRAASFIGARDSTMRAWFFMSPIGARNIATTGTTISWSIRMTDEYGAGTQSACCSTSGPVEEFAPWVLTNATANGRFLKIGVGILQKTIDKYDQFPTLPILNAGKRTFKATRPARAGRRI